MPYHIIVTSKEPRHDNTRLDLSEEELVNTVINPYNEGKPIFCGGRNITTDNVERIKITYNELVSSELYQIIEKELEEERRSRKLVKSIPVEWYIANRGRDVTDRFIRGPPHLPIISEKTPSTCPQTTDLRKVWVVHGRNIEARKAMFTFLRALDLHPVEWEEPREGTGEPTPYIGKVLEVAFSDAQAFLVLLTGDDEGKLRETYLRPQDPEHERVLTPQARQNVIFEAGIAFGHDPQRTVLVELETIRPYSNVAGRHVIKMNNSSEKRHELANRLETAGCAVNRKGTDWLRAGNFNASAREALSTIPERKPLPSHPSDISVDIERKFDLDGAEWHLQEINKELESSIEQKLLGEFRNNLTNLPYDNQTTWTKEIKKFISSLLCFIENQLDDDKNRYRVLDFLHIISHRCDDETFVIIRKMFLDVLEKHYEEILKNHQLNKAHGLLDLLQNLKNYDVKFLNELIMDAVYKWDDDEFNTRFHDIQLHLYTDKEGIIKLKSEILKMMSKYKEQGCIKKAKRLEKFYDLFR